MCQQFSGPAMITFSVATEHLKSQVMIYRGRIRTLQQLYFILWNQKVYNTVYILYIYRVHIHVYIPFAYVTYPFARVFT